MLGVGRFTVDLTKNSLFNINHLYRLGMPFQPLQLWMWAPPTWYLPALKMSSNSAGIQDAHVL